MSKRIVLEDGNSITQSFLDEYGLSEDQVKNMEQLEELIAMDPAERAKLKPQQISDGDSGFQQSLSASDQNDSFSLDSPTMIKSKKKEKHRTHRGLSVPMADSKLRMDDPNLINFQSEINKIIYQCTNKALIVPYIKYTRATNEQDAASLDPRAQSQNKNYRRMSFVPRSSRTLSSRAWAYGTVDDTSREFGYLKACSNLHGLLQKYAKDFNMLIKYNEIFAFLSYPFTSRPLAEAACEESLKVFEYIVTTFEAHTTQFLVSQTNFLIKALQIPPCRIKDMLFENLKILLNRSAMGNNAKLLYKEPGHYLYLRAHYQSLGNMLEEKNVTSENISNALAQISEKIISITCAQYPNMKAADQFLISNFQVLSKTLRINNYQVQKFAINELETLVNSIPTSQMTPSSSREFLSSCYITVVDYAYQKQFNQIESLKILMGLIYEKYPVDQISEVELKLALRSVLVSLSICHGTPLATKPPKKQLDLDSIKYIKSVLANDKSHILIELMNQLIKEENITITIPTYSKIVFDKLDAKFVDALVSKTLPTLYNLFYENPLLKSTPALKTFLQKLKRTKPILFYTPIATLIPGQSTAIASKLMTILHYIGNIIGLNDLLFSEKDLVSLVILSDMKSKKGYSLAQIVFISEIILSFQRIPPVSDLDHATCDLSSAKAHHFMDTIETQIGSLLMYRTKLEGPPLCPLLRYLILNLILEARLHNTEPKRYNWIRVILSWIQGEDSEELLILDNTKIIKELKAVYQDYQFRLTPKLSQSELSELKLPKTIGQEAAGAVNTKNAKSGVSYAGFNLLNGATASFKQHAPYFENVFNKSAIEMSLSLIAVLQPFFTQSESISLLPFLWRYLVINASAPIQVPLSVYAIMVSGDRSEELVTTFIQNNIESGTLESKVDSLQKFSNIFGKRSYIVNHLSSLCLTTKSFRKSNPVVKFVSTSVGIVEPVMQETWLKKLKAAGTSAEEIKMIQSLGWNDDEDEDTWRCDLNPTLVSTVLNELLDKEESSALSSISRKKPILTNLLCNLTSQLNSSLISCQDALYSIRHTILFNILRDEPAWFLRQYFSRVHLLEDSDLEKFATEINQVLLYSHDRPLFFSYLMFNYLLGWGKWAYRSGKNQDLKLINLILPITSRLLPSTHEVTYRELRKNKVDAILVSNGKFWPNDYTTLNLSREQFSNPVSVEELKFNSIPENFFDLTMYRVGQYMIMEFMALKHPADAVAFSQTMITFEPLNWAIKRSKIPTITKAPSSPVITSETNNPKVHTSLLPYLNKIPFKSLSSLHAIAWLTFISRVFDHMDPSNQPRQELETILSGITRILLNHLFNFHVVSKSIQLLARISLQYRRLFNLKSGYSMYLPAVFEAYCISDNPHIHSGIEFFVAFLFNLHQESFLFQMLGCLVPVCLNNTFSSYAKLDTNIALFEWLHCLDQLPTKDSLGILQGLPSHLIEENLDDVKHETVTWLPKVLLPPKTQGWNLLTFQPFPMVKSFKMFITIMSYDPGSVRSEQFVTMLGPLLNHMYKYPGLTELIDEGIKALINIFTKFSKNSSALGKLMKRVSSTGPADDASSGMGTEVNTHNHSSKAAWQQNDRATVKVRFIGLISCYIDVGGEITSKQISSLIYIMKSVFKSPNTSTSTNQGPITNFVKDILLKINDPEQKMIASCELLSVLNSINMSIYRVGPLSDLFSGLTLLIKSFGNSPSSFSDAIQFELLKLSRTGIQFFQNSDNLTVESLNAMSKSFSLFMVMLSELFPEEGINILSELPVGGISLAYIYIPICQYYSKDDKFFFYSQYLSSPEKYAVQKFWSSLLTVVSRPLIEISQYQLTKTNFPTQHSSNMNISVLYSLSHLAIRFILIRAEGLIFGNTLFLHEVITLLRLSIFRPLAMMNYSGFMTVSSDYNQDPIPDAIVNYSGWKLHQLFAKTNHPFLPHIENTINLLIKVSEEGGENSHINPLGIEATQTLSIPKHILPPDSQYLQGRRPSIASVGGISDNFSIGPSHNTARRKSDASSVKNFMSNIMSSHNSRRPSVKSQATNYDGMSLHPQDAQRDITQSSRQANSVIEYGTSTIIQCIIKEIHKCQEDLANLPLTEDQISFISNNTSMEHLPKSKRLSAIDILFPPNNLPEPNDITSGKVSSLEDAMASLRYEVDQLINIFGHHNLQGHTINVERFLMPTNPQPVKPIGRTQPGNHPFVKLSGKT